METIQVCCPRCRSGWRTSTGLAAGRLHPCPRCGHSFAPHVEKALKQQLYATVMRTPAAVTHPAPAAPRVTPPQPRTVTSAAPATRDNERGPLWLLMSLGATLVLGAAASLFVVLSRPAISNSASQSASPNVELPSK